MQFNSFVLLFLGAAVVTTAPVDIELTDVVSPSSSHITRDVTAPISEPLSQKNGNGNNGGCNNGNGNGNGGFSNINCSSNRNTCNPNLNNCSRSDERRNTNCCCV